MDKFPDDLTINKCREIIEKKQLDLLKDTRSAFYKKITENIDKCSQTIDLVFPKNLWNKYKKQILNELLKRFGEIKIVTIDGNITVTRMTESCDDVTKNLDRIVLEFYEN